MLGDAFALDRHRRHLSCALTYQLRFHLDLNSVVDYFAVMVSAEVEAAADAGAGTRDAEGGPERQDSGRGGDTFSDDDDDGDDDGDGGRGGASAASSVDGGAVAGMPPVRRRVGRIQYRYPKVCRLLGIPATVQSRHAQLCTQVSGMAVMHGSLLIRPAASHLSRRRTTRIARCLRPSIGSSSLKASRPSCSRRRRRYVSGGAAGGRAELGGSGCFSSRRGGWKVTA